MAARLTTYVVVGIVAATLIAGLIVGAQRDDNDGPVDLIVHNARVYTADEDQSMAEAVAIRGNRILRVGSNREINRLRRAQTTVIDAHGAAVLPGFNDAHVHLIEGGMTLRTIDLDGTFTGEAIAERLAAWASANPDEPWIRARRWNPAALAGTASRELLDAAVADRPVQIISEDERTWWVNTKALELAGITRDTPIVKGGAIERDGRGKPTGILTGAATELVAKVVPQPSDDARAEALRAAIEAANRHGITSVQTSGDSAEDLALYDAARKEGDLTVRVYGALAVSTAPLTDADTDRLSEVAKKYPDDPWFKTGAAKLTVDGDVASHAAAMHEPYATEPYIAEPVADPDDLNRNVRLLDAHGWQVAANASGDRAVSMALNAFAHAVRSNAAPSGGRRPRIDHLESIAEADLARLRRLGVVATFTPSAHAVKQRAEHIGEERAARGAAIRRFAAAGGRVAFGSNWPESSLDPLAVVQSATGADTDESVRTSPDDRLGLKEAIDAYTANAAYASFDEKRKGAIMPGMLADLVVLTEDIFESPSALGAAKVAVTIFDGKIVYRRGVKPTTP